MRLPVLLVAFGGLAAITVAAVSWGGRMAEPDAAEPVAVQAERATEAPDRPREGADTAPSRARQVAPEVVAPPPLAPESLERVEPRKPLSELALAVPPQPGVPETRLLHRPVATAAGKLEAQGHSIHLAGVVPVEPDQKCTAAGGSSWPCGMVARTAFRSWLRGRAVECVVAEEPAAGPVASACTLGKQDVALWLVENGFALPRPGSAYADSGERAKAEGRGIFGPGPQITR